jgi:hypothetical protein
MALNVLGRSSINCLNVTLCYPENDKTPFFDMLSGKLTRIVVRVDLVPLKNCMAITLTIRISNVVSSSGLIRSGKRKTSIDNIKSSYKNAGQ